MSSLWVGIGMAVVGAGASIYGANKQSKAVKDAAKTNASEQDKINNASWSNWLMSRGMAPTTPVQAGEIPQAGGYNAVNTRLPMWANVNYGTSVAGSNGGMRLVKKGTPRTTGITGLAATPPATPVVEEVLNSDGTKAELSQGKKILRNAMDPLNLMGSEPRTLGNTAKRTLDPFSFFG